MKWGIDLGGTKIEGVILDEKMKPLIRQRISTEASGGYRHILDRISLLVKTLEEKSGLACDQLGIGTPGTIDMETGLIKNSNTQALQGRPFQKDTATQLGIEVKTANDANCFALAEVLMGAIPDHYPNAKLVFGVIMGTGVGGGIILDGKVIVGKNGNTGEWGHSVIDPEGPKCYCGDCGCVETLISGPALEKFYYSISKEKRSLKEINAQYQAGDKHAIQTMERLIHYFGIGLANVIDILDPDAIVLGGGVSNLDILYSQGLESLEKHVFNSRLNTPILRPKLGDSAGVFGAALL